MIYAIFFLSGVSALVFQHIWFRQTGLAFGNSVWASSLVLSSFMAGLALGNGLATRMPAGRGRPLRRYAILEAIVAVTGVALVFILPALGDSLIPWLVGSLESAFAVGVARFAVAFTLLVIPTAAMGLTLPVLVGRAPSRDLFGVTLGRLYGWNTLGAVLGAVAGEAFLYQNLGIRNTAYVAAFLNLTAAALSLWLDRFEKEADRPSEATPPPAPLGAFEIRLLLVAALAGGSLLALEVVWTRFLLLSLFGTALTFAIMLALALAGMSLGSLFASRAARLLESPVAIPVLAMLSAIAVTGSYTSFADALSFNLNGLPGAPWTRVAVLSGALILPAAIVSGALFNAVGVALARSQASLRATGLLTLANTLGAMFGALVAGFVLLPVAGMERSFHLIAAAYVLAAMLSPGFFPGLGTSRVLLAASATGVLFTLLFPTGLMERTYLRSALKPFTGGGNTRVTAFREGLTETITYVDALFQDEVVHSRLVTNGFSMSGTLFSARRYMEAFVYLPVAIHPGMRRALLISYGVGSTARALTETRELERIDVVDISREVLELAPHGIPEGDPAPLSDPRVRTHIEDGRFFLQAATEGYDLITSEPPPPHLGGVVNLYTQEYFDLLKRRLNKGGIVSYWLPVHSLSDEDSRAIASAFCAVFADCTLWKGMNLDWILLGTRDLARVSLERFSRQWTEGGPRDLRALGFETPEQMGALFMGDGRDLPELIGAPPLRDDYPGRLSRTPPAAIDYSPWKKALMNASRGRELFAKSAFVARVWPEEMRERTLPYFAYQHYYDGLMREIVPAADASVAGVTEALSLMRETPLAILPGILLGASGDMRILASRGEALGRPERDWRHAFLGVRDLTEKRYDDAAAHLRRALALAPGSPGLRERLVLTLCLGGRKDEGRKERGLSPLVLDAAWTKALDDACGAPRP